MKTVNKSRYCAAILMFCLGCLCFVHAADQDTSSELANLLKRAGMATKLARNCVITASITGAKTFRIRYVFNGDDFEVQIAQDTRFVHVQNKDWISDDRGKTWRTTGPDTVLRDMLLAPLSPSITPRDGYISPRVESLGLEKVGGEQLLHVRLSPSGEEKPSDDSVPNYWITSDDKRGSFVRRFRGAIVFADHVMLADAHFDDIGWAPKIIPPAN